jgi:hypothetical protein
MEFSLAKQNQLFQQERCVFEHGQEIEDQYGRYYLIEEDHPIEKAPISLLTDFATDTAASEENHEQSELKHMVFLDIESTGLRSEYPLFLIGLLFVKEDKLVLKQLLARHPAEERGVLQAAVDVVNSFSVLVTYNGKKFDIPYIENRLAIHGMPYRFSHFHIDLLWYARRHYRDRLPNCRLATLEEHVLQMKREGDIPGSEIPNVYRRFVKTQNPQMMQGILHHNALDLLSLQKLLFLTGNRRE